MKKLLLILIIFSFSHLKAVNALVPGNAPISGGIVTVIDMDNLTTIATIPVGSDPQRMAVSSDKKKAVVANLTDGTVTVIDLNTFLTTTIAVGITPFGVAITPDSSKAFVVNNGSLNTSVIDLTTSPPSLLTNINSGSHINGGFQGMALTHDGSKLFVIAGASYDFIVPIDVATLTPLTRIPLAGSIFSMAISPDGNTLLAALNNNHVVTPIDVPSLTPLTDISVGSGAPVSIAIDSLNNIAYVANTNSHTITPIDLNTLTPLTDIQIPSGDEPQFIAITPDNTKLFSVNVIGNSVTPIDITGSPVVLTDIAVGNLPQYCVFNSDMALITNFFSSNVTPIDLATLTALTNISVASQPSQAGTYIPSNVPFAPSNFSGKRIVTKSVFEKDLINSLFWTPPVSGNAAFYKIFRNSALTDLAGTVSGNITTFNDHNRKQGVVYTYYLVAVDSNGNTSAPVFLSFP